MKTLNEILNGTPTKRNVVGSGYTDPKERTISGRLQAVPEKETKPLKSGRLMAGGKPDLDYHTKPPKPPKPTISGRLQAVPEKR